MSEWNKWLLFPFILFVSILVAFWFFSASPAEALTIIALALAIVALFVQVLMFVIQAEQSNRQEQQSKELADRTASTLEVIKSSSSNVEYVLQQQISTVIANLLENLHRRTEPIQIRLDDLNLQDRDTIRSSNELERVLQRTRQLLEDLPDIVKESVVDKKVSSGTGVTVGSSAWFDHLVRSFYEGCLEPEQQVFAQALVNQLNDDEVRILRLIGTAELQKKRLVTYPLWEDWDINRKPTEELVAKGLLIGAESGTYFLTPTGRLVVKHILKNV